MRTLSVRMAPAVFDELTRRAERERRRPGDEAGLLLERALGVERRSEDGESSAGAEHAVPEVERG
jgi:hypothetical protein